MTTTLGLIAEIKLIAFKVARLEGDDMFAEKFTQFFPSVSVMDNWPRYTEAQRYKLRLGFAALFNQISSGEAK